jgi:hypothetical protein
MIKHIKKEALAWLYLVITTPYRIIEDTNEERGRISRQLDQAIDLNVTYVF